MPANTAESSTSYTGAPRWMKLWAQLFLDALQVSSFDGIQSISSNLDEHLMLLRRSESILTLNVLLEAKSNVSAASFHLMPLALSAVAGQFFVYYGRSLVLFSEAIREARVMHFSRAQMLPIEMNRAKALYHNSQYRKAEQQVDAILREFPEHFNAQLLKAKCLSKYTEKKHLHAAVRLLEKLNQEANWKQRDRINDLISDIYVSLSEQTRSTSSLSVLSSLGEASFLDELADKAAQQLKQGKCREAISSFTDALNQAQIDYSSRYSTNSLRLGKAKALHCIGNHKSALTLLASVLAMEPKHAEALRLRHKCENALKGGSVRKASSAWQVAGDNYYRKRNWYKAIECYGNAVTSAKHEHLALIEIVDIRLKKARAQYEMRTKSYYLEAFSEVSAILKVYPSNYDAELLLARILSKRTDKGSLQRALDILYRLQVRVRPVDTDRVFFMIIELENKLQSKNSGWFAWFMNMF